MTFQPEPILSDARKIAATKWLDYAFVKADPLAIHQPREPSMSASMDAPPSSVAPSTSSEEKKDSETQPVVTGPANPAPESPQVIPELDSSPDERGLKKGSDESQKVVSFRNGIGRLSEIRKISKNYCRVLHFASHGIDGPFILESEDKKKMGAAEPITSDQLKNAMADHCPYLVIVSSYHCHPCRAAFIDAGIPNVICIHRQLLNDGDRLLEKFISQLTDNLLQGSSVRASFDIATRLLVLRDAEKPMEDHDDDGDADEKKDAEKRPDRSDRPIEEVFQLHENPNWTGFRPIPGEKIPEKNQNLQRPSDMVIFYEESMPIQAGTSNIITKDDPPILKKLADKVKPYIGQRLQIYQFIQQIIRSDKQRGTIVWGQKGVGLTSFVGQAANYLLARSYFDGGVFSFDLPRAFQINPDVRIPHYIFRTLIKGDRFNLSRRRSPGLVSRSKRGHSKRKKKRHHSRMGSSHINGIEIPLKVLAQVLNQPAQKPSSSSSSSAFPSFMDNDDEKSQEPPSILFIFENIDRRDLYNRFGHNLQPRQRLDLFLNGLIGECPNVTIILTMNKIKQAYSNMRAMLPTLTLLNQFELKPLSHEEREIHQFIRHRLYSISPELVSAERASDTLIELISCQSDGLPALLIELTEIIGKMSYPDQMKLIETDEEKCMEARQQLLVRMKRKCEKTRESRIYFAIIEMYLISPEDIPKSLTHQIPLSWWKENAPSDRHVKWSKIAQFFIELYQKKILVPSQAISAMRIKNRPFAIRRPRQFTTEFFLTDFLPFMAREREYVEFDMKSPNPDVEIKLFGHLWDWMANGFFPMILSECLSPIYFENKPVLILGLVSQERIYKILNDPSIKDGTGIIRFSLRPKHLALYVKTERRIISKHLIQIDLRQNLFRISCHMAVQPLKIGPKKASVMNPRYQHHHSHYSHHFGRFGFPLTPNQLHSRELTSPSLFQLLRQIPILEYLWVPQGKGGQCIDRAEFLTKLHRLDVN